MLLNSSRSGEKQQKFHWRTATLHTIGLVAWVVASFIAAQLAVVFGFRAALAMFPELGSLSEAVLQFVVMAAVYVLTLALVLAGSYIVRQRTNLSELGMSKPLTWLDMLLSPAAFIGYMVASSIVVFLVSQTITGFNLEQAQEVGFQSISGRGDLLLAFLALVIVAPIAEEIVFRGYLYGKMRKYTGVIVAALLTSVLFGAVHMQWNVAIDTFVLSLVMCGLREVTGSIWAGTIVHIIKNGVAFFLLFVYPTLVI